MKWPYRESNGTTEVRCGRVSLCVHPHRSVPSIELKSDQGESPKLGRKRGKLRWKLLILFCSSVLTLSIAEIGLRIAAPPEDTGGLFLYVEGADLDSRGKPLAEGMYAGVPVRLNQLGLRDRDLAHERKPKTGRILVLGDSITFGQGVAREDAYPQQLEQLMSRTELGEYSSVEVLNFGIPGYNTCQQYAQFLELGLDFEPDLVVVGFLYNDILVKDNERAAWLGLPPESADVVSAVEDQSGWSLNGMHRYLRKRSLVFRVCSSKLGSVARKMGGSALGQVGSYKFKFVDEDSDWLVVRKALLALRDLGSEHDFAVAVMIIPAMANMTDGAYPLKEYHEAVSEFCQANEVAHLDLLPYFWGLDASQFHVSFLDGHPNAKAHTIMANALAAFILERCSADGILDLTTIQSHDPKKQSKD